MTAKTKADTAAAETKTAETAAVETGTGVATVETAAEEPASSGSVVTDGARARRAIMLKQFVPTPDWINQNIVAGGKGTRATLARISGLATGYEDKANILPDGSTSASIFIKGMFNGESYLTGELSDASGVYFPMAYAERIKAAMDGMGVKTVEVDCDIGLEATGKTIPYEWVVTAFREGQEMDVLRRIRGTRARPANLLVAADGTPKALPAPATKTLPAA